MSIIYSRLAGLTTIASTSKVVEDGIWFDRLLQRLLIMAFRSYKSLIYLRMTAYMVTKCVFITILLCIGSPSIAQSYFTYGTNLTTSGLTFTGDSSSINGMLRVVPAVNGTVGAIFRTSREYVSYNFDTVIDFNIYGNTSGNVDNGDGFAFGIQNKANNALGDGGSGLGYSQGFGGAGTYIGPGIFVEFDTYSDIGIEIVFMDAGGTRTSLASNNIINPIGAHTVQITYNSLMSGGTLNVYLDHSASPTVSRSGLNLNSLLNLNGSQTAFVGVTGANGANNNNVDIPYWVFSGGASSSTIAPEASTLCLLLLGIVVLPVPLLQRRRM